MVGCSTYITISRTIKGGINYDNDFLFDNDFGHFVGGC